VPFIPIDDPADPRLEDYRNVPDPELIEQRGIFIAEGRFVVARLLEGTRFAARSALVTDAARRAMDGVFDARAELPVYVVPPWIINAVTGFNIHRGCLAIGERAMEASWQTLAAGARRLVVVERVANADNVGGIFRNAAAFGADAVLLESSCTDPLYRKAIRTSMGAALQVPFARMAPWPGALHALRGEPLWSASRAVKARAACSLVALTPAGTATLAEAAAALPRDQPLAIVLGHEGDGLTAGALEACDVHARIPMAPGVDSLNVATTCAIALYALR
jgi:tRNA G18 (ribose-2'-O)-methylase SpoU